MYILFLIFYFFCCIYLVLINICNIDWVLLVYQFFTAMCYPQKINLLLCNYLLMIMGMIHWTKISGHFSLKLKGLNQKSFKKACPPFEVDHFSQLGQWIEIDHSIWPFWPILQIPRTGIAEVTGSNPVEALIFFQASSFQFLKLENLLWWSLFTFIYNCSTNMNYFI